jgi:hypothetical protein
MYMFSILKFTRKSVHLSHMCDIYLSYIHSMYLLFITFTKKKLARGLERLRNSKICIWQTGEQGHSIPV